MRTAVLHTGLGVFVVAALCIRVVATDNSSSASDQIRAQLAQIRSELTELRRDLHRHLEASGEEKRTSEIVAKRLRALGLGP